MLRSHIQRGVLLYSCAVFVLGTAAVSADPPVRLRLIFEDNDVLPAPIRDAAALEAAHVWQPYGIVVEAGEPTVCRATEMTLAVAVDLDDDKDSDNGLGTVRFDSDGVPDSNVTLHYGNIVKLAMSATVMGWQAERWPAALRDQIIARAAGRALAHEIGHIVLRWPHHPASGLMRGQFGASALADPDGTGFALTATDWARLHIAMNAFAAPPRPAEDPLGALVMVAGRSVCRAS